MHHCSALPLHVCIAHHAKLELPASDLRWLTAASVASVWRIVELVQHFNLLQGAGSACARTVLFSSTMVLFKQAV
jgi:hypothetical protein